MVRTRTLVALAAAVAAGSATSAQAKKFDSFKDHSSNSVVNRIDFGSNGVSIDAPGKPFKVYEYGSDSAAGAFYGRGKNTAADSGSVSNDKFISRGTAPFTNGRHIEFTFDSPVNGFGFTTIDLLESYVAPDAYLALIAYDSEGKIVDKQLRTGPQGYSGLALGWEVGNLGRLIARARLIGELWAGAAGGFDDFFIEELQTVEGESLSVVPLPTTAGMALASLAGLGLRRRRA